jgi:hypothetical protein
MNEEKAREILGPDIGADGSLFGGENYLHWSPGEQSATLDGSFTADDLEAIAWWMRNKK